MLFGTMEEVRAWAKSLRKGNLPQAVLEGLSPLGMDAPGEGLSVYAISSDAVIPRPEKIDVVVGIYDHTDSNAWSPEHYATLQPFVEAVRQELEHAGMRVQS